MRKVLQRIEQFQSDSCIREIRAKAKADSIREDPLFKKILAKIEAYPQPERPTQSKAVREISQAKPPPTSKSKTKSKTLLDGPDILVEDTESIAVVKVVGYYSGLHQGAARHYTTLEQEASSLLRAVNHFSDILAGANRIFLVTDSQSLIWLLASSTKGIPKYQRMAQVLLTFPFKIIVGGTLKQLMR